MLKARIRLTLELELDCEETVDWRKASKHCPPRARRLVTQRLGDLAEITRAELVNLAPEEEGDESEE
jgi:hypothetical protein